MNPTLRILAGIVGGSCALAATSIPVAHALQPVATDRATVSHGAASTSDQTATAATLASSGAATAGTALSVSPGSSLFDIRLVPGQVERRLATLTNSGTVPLDVSLSANVTTSDGPASAARHLLIGSAPVQQCHTAHHNSAAMLADHSLSQGRIAAGATKQVCVAVSLAPAATGLADSTTAAHLEFDAIEATSSSDDQLAYTGADLLAAALAAAAALFLGLATLRRRRPVPTLSEPHTELS